MAYVELSTDETEKALAILESIESILPLIEAKECVACSGTGRYDNGRSPVCGSCKGHGGEETNSDHYNNLVRMTLQLSDIDPEEADTVSRKIAQRMESLRLPWLKLD